MVSQDRFCVTFAEDDNMFWLMDMALQRSMTPQGQRVLRYFTGADTDRAAVRLFDAADAAGLGDVRSVVRDPSRPLANHLDGTDMLVVEAERISGDDLEHAEGLAIVQKFGAVLDNIDTRRARALGIPVATMQRRTTVSCAEHVLALMLALSRRLLAAHDGVVSRLDDPARPTVSTGQVSTAFNWGGVTDVRLLQGRTLGLVGFGEIAREVAVRATAFGMNVVYHKRSPVEPGSLPASLRLARHVGLDELLRTSDVVSIHLPSNPATDRLLDEAALATMKPSAWLVNMARGALVDERALEAALRGGRLAAAALDVHREEPIPLDSGLLRLDNVVLTPHMASGGAELVLQEVEQMLGLIAHARGGQRPAVVAGAPTVGGA